jgi:hypothetical protein
MGEGDLAMRKFSLLARIFRSLLPALRRQEVTPPLALWCRASTLVLLNQREKTTDHGLPFLPRLARGRLPAR